MFEKIGNKPLGIILTTLLGMSALSGCAQNTIKPVSTTKPTLESVVPPLAQLGEIFSCTIKTQLETLAEAGETSSAQVLSSDFHETQSEFLTTARFGLSICQRSITETMAKTAGIVVKVPEEPNDTCITWSAIYNNKEQAQIGGPTNYIGLICVPKVTE